MPACTFSRCLPSLALTSEDTSCAHARALALKKSVYSSCQCCCSPPLLVAGFVFYSDLMQDWLQGNYVLGSYFGSAQAGGWTTLQSSDGSTGVLQVDAAGYQGTAMLTNPPDNADPDRIPFDKMFYSRCVAELIIKSIFAALAVGHPFCVPGKPSSAK